MTDKEISSVDSLKASFKSGVRLMPEAFSHLIDEAYKVYETIDGVQGDGPTAGLKRDDKGKLTLNTQHSGGLNSNQGALALSLKSEGGLSFDGNVISLNKAGTSLAVGADSGWRSRRCWV